MIIAGIDFETTSVDPQTCLPTEIAIIRWDPHRNSIVESISVLLEVPLGLVIDNYGITGLDSSILRQHGFSWMDVEDFILRRLQTSNYIMAHNVEFDRIILKRLINWDSYLGEKPFDDNRWIDTMTDVPYPDNIKTRSLLHLAAEHGFLNPFPHRALFDVMTMIKIAGMYDLNEVIRYADSPNIWVRAGVSMDDRQKAKDRNYRWDPVNKFWVKQIKELNLEKEEEGAEFPIDILNGYVYKEEYI
jgi:DNA polymerase-3 subunit epsilon